MDPITTPAAAPSQAPASSQPASDAAAYVDAIFNGTAKSTDVATAPVDSTPVSPQPAFPTHLSALPTAPVANPVPASVQPVNGQQAAAPPENPLPIGVRQRLAEMNERTRQAEARAAQRDAEVAEMRGYLIAQNQAAQQQRQPQRTPDLVSETEAWVDHTQNRLVTEAQALIQRERQALEQQQRQLAAQVQTITGVAAQAAWQSDRQRAIARYGEAAVAAVETELQENPEMGNRYSFVRPGVPATDPYTRAVADYRNRQLSQAIPNGDIEAFKQRAVQEYLASNPQALNQQANAYAQQQRQAYAASPQPLTQQPSGGSAIPSISANPNDDLDAMFARQRAERMARARQQGRVGALG